MIKKIVISVETAAATLVKRYSYLTQCAAGLIIKEISISVETAATTLVKRYGYLSQCAAGLIIKAVQTAATTLEKAILIFSNQGCSHPSKKKYLNFI